MESVLVTLDTPAAAGPSFVEQVIPIAAILLIFYFLLIRPQQQKEKEKQAMIAALKKDDQVVTSSGLHGKVIEVVGETVVLDVGNKVRLTFDKSAVGARLPEKAAEKSEKKE